MTSNPTANPTFNPTLEPTLVITPEPVAVQTSTSVPSKSVTFSMKLSMTADQFEANRAKVKEALSEQLGVALEFITVNVVARRRARRFLSEVVVEATIQTDNDTPVINAVNEESFESDMSARLSNKTSLTVAVTEVSDPLSESINQDSSSSSGNYDALYILAFLALVVAVGGTVYYTMEYKTGDDDFDSEGEAGGAEMELTEKSSKRTIEKSRKGMRSTEGDADVITVGEANKKRAPKRSVGGEDLSESSSSSSS